MRCPRICHLGHLVRGQTVCLPQEASHYINHVLRLKAGSTVVLFNGSGAEFKAVIVAQRRSEVLVRINSQELISCESPLSICLGLAVLRGDAMDYILQKAVELGVTSIVPLQTERCEMHLKTTHQQKKLEHWRAITITACAQCGRNRLPTVSEIVPFEIGLQQIQADTKWVLTPHAQNTLNLSSPPPQTLALLIGPPGGFSPGECTQAIAAQFTPAKLGSRILRTETAVVAMLSLVQGVWGDLLI